MARLVLAACACIGVVTAAPPRPVRLDERCHRPFPAFVWAGSSSALTEQGRGLAEVGGLGGYQHRATDVRVVAERFLTAAVESPSLKAAVVVLSQGDAFSTSSVSSLSTSSGGGQRQLHAETAKGIFPYVYPAAQPLLGALPGLARGAGLQGSVETLPLEQAQARVRGFRGDAAEASGVADCLVAVAPADASIEETDAMVRDLERLLETETGGKHFLLWTGSFHGEGCGHRALVSEANYHRRLQTSSARYIKCTPDILAGLLFLLLFLFILVSGLGCLGDIEYPKTFVSVNPAPGREF